ncbi:MAG TPA: zf-HC2 domain-containing protein [Vicinamibacterales bacterium]|nr:zf-HC2 domain-containing protein [Vicinamibacterales bacterium]
MADRIRNCGDLDERLTPFVDGEAAPAENAAVGAHLAACPPCRTQADNERTARDLIREHRAELSPRAPAALRERCARLRAIPASGAAPPGIAATLRKWAPLSVAATLVLAVAVVFLLGLNDGAEALAASLAVDHVKCFKVSVPAAPVDAADEGRQWQQKQGWPVVIPPAAAAEELQLVDVRRCYSSDGRAAHLMYNWRGKPLSLFVLPQDTGRQRALRKIGQDAIIWSANQRTYAVIASGGPPPQDLTRVVAYFKATAK